MAGDEGKVKIDKFDGKDFGFWKMQIEDYLYQKKLHLPLAGMKPEDMSQADWELLDRQALGSIRLTLAKNVAFNILEQKTTADLMRALSNMYEKPSASNKVHLMRRLFNLKMIEGASVTDHINEFNLITSQLNSVDVNFEDEVRALILLSSLPESWDATVTAVSSSCGSNQLKFEEVRDLILSEDIRRKESKGNSSSALMIQESRGRTTQRNKGRGRSKSKQRSQSRPKGDGCWHCGKKGHTRKNCWARKENKGKNEESANAVTEVLSDALVLSVDSPMESWILDSGASFHSTSQMECMQNYTTGDFGKVYLADDEPLDIVGRGDVHIRLPNQSVWKLKNVRHVPGLKRNLISVGQLDAEGYNITFVGASWKISKGAMVVARGSKVGTLYMTGSIRDTVALMQADSELWHHRLGHMSETGMQVMLKKGKLTGLKSLDIGFCEDCVLGKQKRVSFTKIGRTPRARKLELVHTDVWGPSPVTSYGASQYYVTFIDDSTRKVWVYFLKNKSDVFSTFRKWKSLVENESGEKIKCLRSDNGGEYDSTEFKEFCAANGIKMEKTVPSTPQQNGVAERMNRTLNERARSMRIHAGLPKMFWAEAVSTAAYLINRGPSSPIDNKLPEEEWTGKPADLSHLKVFGCVSYVLINPERRDKLDAKSKKCFFIGYGTDEFGYKFWSEQDRKFIRSKDVVFNERSLYKDKDVPDSAEQSVQEKEQIELEEITEDDIARRADENPVPEPETPQLRRSTRATRAPARYSPSLHYLLLTDGGEPECYEEAVESRDSVQWELAMKDEMQSLDENQTWELSTLPEGKKALHNKWVYKIKEEPDGSKRYKARLVVKGFQQKEGIDYTEIFSPVVKLSTIRVILSIVAAEDLYLEQLDVKTAFLHGEIDEDIYMEQPVGFIVPGKEQQVCKLKRSLYGLKQAPRLWYKKFDGFMINKGFARCQEDHCCYFRILEGSFIILLLYVDDMLIAGPNMQEIERWKKELSREFAMKDLGAAKQILGLRIERDRVAGTLKMTQSSYIEKVLDRFNMTHAKPVKTPLAGHFRLSKEQSPKDDDELKKMAGVPYASAVGSLMYAMVCTRPDIAHAVGAVSRYMANPGKQHWEAVKWILRYLKGTKDVGLCYRRGSQTLQGFVDADLGGDTDTRKSTTGYVFTIGGTAVSWVSQLQKIVVLSTTEAEYVAITEASKEMIWLQNLLRGLDREQSCSVLFSDSQSAIHLGKNPVFHARTKHIQLRYYFIRGLLEDGTLSLEKVEGSKNPADMLTKVVTTDKLRLCMASIGLQSE